jgi:hypothetical protein
MLQVQMSINLNKIELMSHSRNIDVIIVKE